jgi:3-oxoacyl-[acyl-carrier protein] reductase
VEQMVAGRIPKGRLAEPEDIVGTVLFLCSEDSDYITGETIYVDGGSLANY